MMIEKNQNILNHIIEEYWIDQLTGDIVKTSLPSFGVLADDTMWRETVLYRMPEDTYSKIKKICKNSDMGIFVFLVAGLNALLHRYTNNEDIILGSTNIITEQEYSQDNLFFLRNKISGEMNFKELLNNVKQIFQKAWSYQTISFGQIYDKIKVKTGVDELDIFNIAFISESIQKPTPSLEKFDLIITLKGSDAGEFEFKYNSKLYEKVIVSNFARHLMNFFENVLTDLNNKISSINILSAEDIDYLIYGLNDTTQDFPRERISYQLFEEHAQRTPDKIAVEYLHEKLTYGELNEKANKLGRFLREKGISNDRLVPILCERSIEMLIAILGVFKAGGGYVPLDTNYSIERIKLILAETKSRLLLTTSEAITNPELFYTEMFAFTQLEWLVYLDKLENHPEGYNLLEGFNYDGEDISHKEIQIKVNHLRLFLEKKLKELVGSTGVMVSNPIYRLISTLSLEQLSKDFVFIDPKYRKKAKEQIIEESNIQLIISESKYLDELDQILWESQSLSTYILLDSYEIKSQKKDTKEVYFKEIWNHVAKNTSGAVNDYGWSNSYTGERFSIAEMEEYIENFKTKLKPYLKPDSRVFEIGCGHGLVMFQIAPEVSYYLATDLSDVIVEKNRQRLEREGLKHVEIIPVSAAEIDTVPKREFDLVVCSSVVHYFPNTLYLEKVIGLAINLLKDEGVIYLDDLMNLGQKSDLIQSTVDYKKKNPNAQIKVDWDNDLFVDLDFFHDLQSKMPEIVAWESSKKLGTIDNELTRYRYDVVLKINKTHQVNSNPANCKKQIYIVQDIERFTPQVFQDVNLRSGEVFDQRVWDKLSGENLEPISRSSDMAYVIYTSGSTGKPKGVMVEHIGMMNHLQAKINETHMDDRSIVVQNASQCFDISVWQFLAALMVGGKTVIYDNDLIFNIQQFVEKVQKDQVTILEVVPSYLSVILDWLESISPKVPKFERLKYLFVTGEALKPNLIKRWFVLYPDIPMVNAYGPTEASDDITHFVIDHILEEENIPIGKPLQNFNIYIVDEQMNLCPAGVKGEICVSGVGVGRGYLNDPEKTAQVFMADPFVGKDGVRLYKTGDLGRFRTDGLLEYFGRKDFQVKIRGFRIELGEIENRLADYPGCKEAVVIDRVDGQENKYLCAYLVTNDEYDPERVIEFLAEYLPEYMIPAYFVPIDKLPLTPNGKIDRKNLPDPEEILGTNRKYLPPVTDTETRLAKIWSEILGVEKIGRDDSFFDLGGHSLKATQLIAKILKEFNVQVELRDVFRIFILKDFAAYIEKGQNINYSMIPVAEEESDYPVSSAQKRLYVLNHLEGINTSYNMPGAMIIEGDLDYQHLEVVIHELIQRHETLRTSFTFIKGELRQKIISDLKFEMEYLETTDMEIEVILRDFVRPFDLSQAPLFRAELAKKDESYILLFDMHHIISDGISSGILFKEFCDLYEGKELAPLRIQYKDFTIWQNELLNSEIMQKQEDYWLEMFSGELPVLNLPIDYPRPALMQFEGEISNYYLGNDLSEKVNQLLSETQTTLYMFLLAAYNVFLAKYTGQEDIIVGTPIAGRLHLDLEKIIGMFVNTLALRNQPAGSKTFRGFLQEVKDNSLKALENQDYQFETLIDKLNLQRDLSRNPLFDTMLAVQNMEMVDLNVQGLKITPYKVENKIAKFDLSIFAVEKNDGIHFVMEYSTHLFRPETIEQMARHFKSIIAEVVVHLDVPISQIQMIDPQEKEELVITFNETEAQYPKDQTIAELFTVQALKTPEKMAVVHKDQDLTYGELNHRADQLAALLRRKGVTPNQIIGIMVDHSPAMLIGVLGVLKAGAAYVPIDPEYPLERIQFMLEDCEVSIVLTQKQLADKVIFAREIVDIDDLEIFVGSPKIELVNKPADLAYVIYTSGSTGRPKGVMIEHQGLTNYIKWAEKVYLQDETEDYDFPLYSSFAFDLTVTSIYLPLVSGNRITIYSNDDDQLPLSRIVREDKVNIMKLTPTHLKILLELEFAHSGLKTLIVGGEDLKTNLANEIYQKFGQNIRIYNEYGPTETVVGCMIYQFDPKKDERISVPIGKPIDNAQIYLLDQYLNPVPVGVTGEIYISGDGVGRGYLNRREFTNEKFVTQPWNQNRRMYKTGDLARRLRDGNIEFIGRIDSQVKIRGYRIEPGEIERQLVKYPGVSDVVVLAVDEAELAVYVVAVEECIEDLKTYLSKRLPAYMIPAYFIRLDSLPLTSNGKIDYKALPVHDLQSSSKAEYMAPQSLTEIQLAKIWSEILDFEPIGIKDNFFDLGGHSLKAIKMTSRVYKEFQIDLPLKVIFDAPTIKELAQYINGIEKSDYISIPIVEERDYYPVSSAQKRLFIVNERENLDLSYNMPGIVRVENELERDRFEQAIYQLIDRHESLRTSFEFVNGELVQKVHSEINFKIDYWETDESDVAEVVRGFIRPFDLSRAPLLRVGLITLDKGYIMMFDMHHIISDGSSMDILMTEFVQLYSGEDLPDLRIQYKDYAVWQNQLIQSERLKKQEEYWLSVFADQVPILDLPTDFPHHAEISFAGDVLEFPIPEELALNLRGVAVDHGSTLFMLLLAAYNVLLSKYTGQNDIVVGTPVSGRPHADLENIMGMFVNTLALRNHTHKDKSFVEFLLEVKENSINAYQNQGYPFEMLVEKVISRGRYKMEKGRNPLFDVCFVLQNKKESYLEIVSALKIRPYEMTNKTAKFDLMLVAGESDSELNLALEYKTDLFREATIVTISQHYTEILHQIAEKPTIRLKEIQISNELLVPDESKIDEGDFDF